MGIALICALMMLFAVGTWCPPPVVAAPAHPKATAIKHNNAGVDFFNAGKYDQAIQEYNEAVRFDPKYTEAYSNRGAAFDALNNPERAVQDYTAAIELNPTLTAAYSNRASAYGDLGNFEKALADWNVVLHRQPNSQLALSGRGTCYQSLGNLKAALADFERAVRLKPDDEKAMRSRDAVKKALQYAVSNPQTASTTLAPTETTTVAPEPAGTVPPTSASAGAGSSLPVVSGSPGAPATSQTSVTLSPQAKSRPISNASPTGLFADISCQMLGNVWMWFGQYRSADACYSEALAANGRDGFAYFRRGNARARQGDNQAALADYDQAVQYSPHLRQAFLKRDKLRGMAAPSGSQSQTPNSQPAGGR